MGIIFLILAELAGQDKIITLLHYPLFAYFPHTQQPAFSSLQLHMQEN